MNISNQYFSLLKKISNLENKILNMTLKCNDLKIFLNIKEELEQLKQLKNELEPFYFEETMLKCSHVFIKTSYKLHEWNDNRYLLFTNHYCLKCGCTTKNLNKEYLNELGIKFIPAFLVKRNKQIEIVENAKNYQVINCNESNIYDLIIKWENIKKQKLKFDEQLKIFLNNIDLKEKPEDKENKVYEFKYL